MYKIVICDDEQYIRNMLLEYLEKLQSHLRITFQITCFSSGEELLQHIKPDTDILLLDIKMHDLTGMNAAHSLRKDGFNACIVFITSMIQYALEGYEVHAFAFITKPLHYQQFERTMLEALQTLKSSQKHTLVLRQGTVLNSIIVESILYVETLDHTSAIVTADGRENYNISLKKIASELVAWGFGLCHKSYLVNFRQVCSVQPTTLLLSNQKQIPLSRHRRKQFLEEFTSFMGGQL